MPVSQGLSIRRGEYLHRHPRRLTTSGVPGVSDTELRTSLAQKRENHGGQRLMFAILVLESRTEVSS
eukprot:scaffold66_cov299-Pavlova_lutheri.AAC.2